MGHFPEITAFEKDRLKAWKFRYECKIARREAGEELSFIKGLELVEIMEMMNRFSFEDAEGVEGMCREGANLELKDDGMTPLLFAACRGYSRSVKILIDCGADMEVTDDFGYTALIFAAIYGSFQDVKLLIDSGADNINAKSNSGQTALMRAAESYGWP